MIVDTIVLAMVVASAVMLSVAAVLTVIRMSRGPSSLDRVVAADVLIAVVIAASALDAILDDHSTTLPVMLVLSLLGFAVYLASAKKENAALGSMTKNKGPEPTGRPRMASGTAETANERQGQV